MNTYLLASKHAARRAGAMSSVLPGLLRPVSQFLRASARCRWRRSFPARPPFRGASPFLIDGPWRHPLSRLEARVLRLAAAALAKGPMRQVSAPKTGEFFAPHAVFAPACGR